MKLFIALTILFSLNSFAQLKVEKELSLTEEILKEIPAWDTKTQERVKKYSPLIIQVAKKLEIEPKLLLSVAWAESHFKPEAKSFVGAVGIMQVKPSTQRYILDKELDDNLRAFYTATLLQNDFPHEIIDNILSGGLYIKYLLNKFDGDSQKAVIAYNIGPTGTYRLIKNNGDLNHHRYYLKISKNMIAMN